ncbi:MAG: TetR/AcrR family transcriptional regulator [Pseudomonadota bacterium]
MRKEPSQKRSSDKVADILDAAEQLLLELPLEDITSKMIAERAGVTRTSMYHFFPSKIDVMDALSERYHNQLRQRIFSFFDPQKREDYHRAWIGVSDVYKQFFEESPAAAVLLLGANGAKQVLFGDEASEERLANDLEQLMTRHTNLWELSKGPPPEPDFFQFVLRMMTSLFSAGIRKEGKISKTTEDAVKKATIAYLDSTISNRQS